MRNYYKPGDWNVLCDRCGFEYKASMLKDEWTGLKTCSSCWDPKHPSLLMRTPKEDPSTPWSRPEPADNFTTVPYIASTIGKQT